MASKHPLLAFLEEYIFGKDGLLLTIKSNAGASINVDGPFEAKLFEWTTWRPKAGKPDETVIQPTWAEPRGGSQETSVHMHLPWEILSKACYVRLWYTGKSEKALIDQDVRICFFADEPPAGSRGDELFWFYAFATGPNANPLCEKLPAKDSFSECRRLGSL